MHFHFISIVFILIDQIQSFNDFIIIKFVQETQGMNERKYSVPKKERAFSYNKLSIEKSQQQNKNGALQSERNNLRNQQAFHKMFQLKNQFIVLKNQLMRSNSKITIEYTIYSDLKEEGRSSQQQQVKSIQINQHPNQQHEQNVVLNLDSEKILISKNGVNHSYDLPQSAKKMDMKLMVKTQHFSRPTITLQKQNIYKSININIDSLSNMTQSQQTKLFELNPEQFLENSLRVLSQRFSDKNKNGAKKMLLWSPINGSDQICFSQVLTEIKNSKNIGSSVKKKIIKKTDTKSLEEQVKILNFNSNNEKQNQPDKKTKDANLKDILRIKTKSNNQSILNEISQDLINLEQMMPTINVNNNSNSQVGMRKPVVLKENYTSGNSSTTQNSSRNDLRLHLGNHHSKSRLKKMVENNCNKTTTEDFPNSNRSSISSVCDNFSIRQEKNHQSQLNLKKKSSNFSSSEVMAVSSRSNKLKTQIQYND